MRMFRSRVFTAAAVTTVLSVCSHSTDAAVNVVELSASQIKLDLLAHTYTARDLVDSYLAQIDQYNFNYNAFTLLDRTGAQAQADALDALLANPVNIPTLAAEPMLGSVAVIKDSMNIGGMRTTSGFNGFTNEYVNVGNGQHGVDMVALNDAPIVSRMRTAGAIILGKTNLPTFARSGANANTSTFGPTYAAYS